MWKDYEITHNAEVHTCYMNCLQMSENLLGKKHASELISVKPLTYVKFTIHVHIKCNKVYKLYRYSILSNLENSVAWNWRHAK